MKKLLCALTVLLCISTASFAAGPACYSAEEMEAEQGLRITSELMVIGLTCLKMPQGGPQLYTKYQSFTKKNQRLITGYEEQLISYYRRTGSGNPEGKLHTLRTQLANEISQHAISMSTTSFCKFYGGRIDKALAMDNEKVRRWAQHSWSGSTTSRPSCTKVSLR
jgi:hypothetical protein